MSFSDLRTSFRNNGKTTRSNGIVHLLIDKLLGISADLVINDDNWHKWNFRRFAENLRKRTERNPVVSRYKQISFQPRKERILQISQKKTDSKKVTNIRDRKRIVTSKKLCFNYLYEDHQIIECKNKGTCCNCNSKHHTSI